VHLIVGELNADIRGWIADWNENPLPFVWTKSADKGVDSITHHCN
jgi:hypothetical protein